MQVSNCILVNYYITKLKATYFPVITSRIMQQSRINISESKKLN